MEEKGKLALLAAVAGAMLLLFFRLGSYPLLDPDEARFARTSVSAAFACGAIDREM